MSRTSPDFSNCPAQQTNVTCRRLIRGLGNVTELRNKYGYNLPPIAALHRFYDRERSRQMVSSILNETATPPVIRLLFSGRLPVDYVTSVCTSKPTEAPVKKPYKYKPIRQRERNLWEPRRTAAKTDREINTAVFEARYRHRQCITAISEKAHSHVQVVERALMRHLLVEPRGFRTYLNKLERETKTLVEKYERDHGNKTPRRKSVVGGTVTLESQVPQVQRTSSKESKHVTIASETSSGTKDKHVVIEEAPPITMQGNSPKEAVPEKRGDQSPRTSSEMHVSSSAQDTEANTTPSSSSTTRSPEDRPRLSTSEEHGSASAQVTDDYPWSRPATTPTPEAPPRPSTSEEHGSSSAQVTDDSPWSSRPATTPTPAYESDELPNLVIEADSTKDVSEILELSDHHLTPPLVKSPRSRSARITPDYEDPPRPSTSEEHGSSSAQVTDDSPWSSRPATTPTPAYESDELPNLVIEAGSTKDVSEILELSDHHLTPPLVKSPRSRSARITPDYEEDHKEQ